MQDAGRRREISGLVFFRQSLEEAFGWFHQAPISLNSSYRQRLYIAGWEFSG